MSTDPATNSTSGETSFPKIANGISRSATELELSSRYTKKMVHYRLCHDPAEARKRRKILVQER